MSTNFKISIPACRPLQTAFTSLERLGGAGGGRTRRDAPNGRQKTWAGARRWIHKLAVCLLVLATAGPVAAQEAEAELPWELGPTKGEIADRAGIDVPAGFMFLGPDGVRQFDELNQNPPSGTDEYIIVPTTGEWVAYFHFDEVGYVKDDEKLDANDILASVKEGGQESNEERRMRGWNTLTIDGWRFKPQYDARSKLLEWAILAHNDQTHHQIVNYNTRLLGRHGVMKVVLVAAPEKLDTAVAQLKTLMPGFAYNPGQGYAEFKQGDRIAEYGLAALITGGAAAVAAKKGFLVAVGLFLAKIWKLVLVALAVAVASVRKFFGRKADAPQ